MKRRKQTTSTIRLTTQVSRIACIIIILLGIIPALAQEEMTRQLTLKQAIEFALQKNISLQRSGNQYRLAEVSLKQSRSDFYPAVSAGASHSWNYDNGMNETRSMSASMSASLNLFNGFGDMAGYRSAQLAFMSEEASLQRQRETIIFETTNRFLQAILDSAFINIEIENLNAQRLQLKKIEEFKNAGNRSIADVYQQLSDIQQSELQVLQARNNADISRLRLQQQLGYPIEKNIRPGELAIDTIVNELLVSEKDTGLPDAESDSSALVFRADARSQHLQISAAGQNISAARAGYWPTLSLSVSAGSSYNSVPKSGLFDQFLNENKDARIGLSLNIPLFDRFQTCYNVQRAKINRNDQELALKNLKLQISAELQEGLLNYHSAIKQREAARALYQYSAEALKISEERYRVGAVTYVELSEVRANYISAAYKRASADYNLLQHYVTLHYYRGDLDQAVIKLYQ